MVGCAGVVHLFLRASLPTAMKGFPIVAVVFSLWTIATSAQVPSAPPHSRSEIIAAARSITGKARVVDPFVPEDDLTIWIATNPLSRKVGEVAANPRVTLLYFDTAAESFVTVIGAAQVVRDPAEKAKRWKTEWVSFYKDANRGDDYLLIRVTPSRLEVVAESLGMINDPGTWRPVILDLRPR